MGTLKSFKNFFDQHPVWLRWRFSDGWCHCSASSYWHQVPANFGQVNILSFFLQKNTTRGVTNSWPNLWFPINFTSYRFHYKKFLFYYLKKKKFVIATVEVCHLVLKSWSRYRKKSIPDWLKFFFSTRKHTGKLKVVAIHRGGTSWRGVSRPKKKYTIFFSWWI